MSWLRRCCAATLLLAAISATAWADDTPLAWIEGLEEGQRQALVQRRPLLVRVGGAGCQFCKLLEQEIAKPEVQQALGGWTLVYVSIDKSPDVARQLGVTGIPALRLQTVSGLPVAKRDGFMPADELIAWLDQHREAARATPDAVLLSDSEPSAIDIVKLTRQFSDRSAAVREAAVGRLRSHARLAAAPVVRSFESGNLATRLTALELLQQWQAPIDGLDPWRVETLTDEKLAALTEWAKVLANESADAEPAGPPPAPLTDEQMADVRRQLDRMLESKPLEAAAIRDRLARFGGQIRDEVLARLRTAETDEDHERLLALRYRLAASSSLVLRWPGGLERLAATDNRQRHAAAEQLVALATDAEQTLLEELFSDPDPLVREISLRGLQALGSSSARESMIRLLDDPEPNVRAAVLKQFAENPSAALVPKVAEYVATEEDADLVVHAIRFFRQAKGNAALESMVSLLDHESWRVRAEAAEGTGELCGDAPTELKARSYAALIELLDDEDGFVVSRAVKGLRSADMPTAVTPLVAAAKRHPELLLDIIAMLSQGNMSRKAESHLREFAKHEQPSVRAAAVAGLSGTLGASAGDVIATALADDHSDVRIAAAEAILSQMDALRSSQQSMLESGPTPDLFSAPVEFAPQPSVLERVFDLFTGGAQQPQPAAEPKASDLFAPEGEDGAEPATEPKASDLFAPEGEDGAEPATKEASEDAVEDRSQSVDEDANEDPVEAGNEVPPRRVPVEPPMDFELPTIRPQPLTPPPPLLPQPSRRPVDPEVVEVDIAEPMRVTDSADDRIEPNQAAQKYDEWLVDFHSGKAPMLNGRPKWVDPLVEPLEKMLAASAPHERATAAVTLTALGRGETALPVLVETAGEEALTISTAAGALPWLVWDKRIELFEQLLSAAETDDQRQDIVYQMRNICDQRAIPKYWAMLADPEIGLGVAQTVQQAVMWCYAGQRWNDFGEASAEAKQRALEEAKPRATSGPELQRVAALGILSLLDRDEAKIAAQANLNDPESSEALQNDSFQVLLTVSDKAERQQLAIEALTAAATSRRKLALRFLVDEQARIWGVRGFSALDLSDGIVYGGNEHEVIEAPEGLQADTIRPLLDDPDADIAAQAAYLLALLGEAEGLPRLIAHWRANQQSPYEWQRLVYRAIAILDDSRQLPLLQEIYRQLDPYEVRDFYWTIRIMTGPEMIQFRKQIRDTFGMQNLQ